MSLFGTAGVRGPVGETVTPELAIGVGRAVAAEAETVVVGRDARPTGEALADAVAAGLESGGADVTRLGCVPTPALAFASRDGHGVMVTASHNPPADNGLKLFADGAEFETDAENRIAERVTAGIQSVSWDRWGGSETGTVLPKYRDAVAIYAGRHGMDPDGRAVAVDCGNGTAGLVTPQVLSDIGARVHALNANPDGHTPARASKPTAESLAALRAYVAESDCTLGLGHDGDGDRLVVVDAQGDVVAADTIVAVLAHHYVAASSAANPVVLTTPNASGRIDEHVTDAGGTVERVALGALHEGLASTSTSADAESPVVFAAEPWKHLHPGFGPWIDAVASAAVLVRLVAGRGLEALTGPVSEPPARTVSLDCPEERKAPAMAELRESVPERFPEATVDETHGLRLTFADGGWLLIRPSGTEPKLRLYAEGPALEDRVEVTLTAIEAAIGD